MNISDIVALAKSGYKISEIKELLSLEPAPAPEPEPAPVEEIKQEEQSKEEVIDYKLKYEALLEENRKASLQRDISGSAPEEPSAEEIVNKALAELLN